MTSHSNSLPVYMSLCMSVCLSLGLLPLRGIIPDMTSDSDKYVQLHSFYREQAAVDVVAVTTHLLRLLQTIGRVTWHVMITVHVVIH